MEKNSNLAHLQFIVDSKIHKRTKGGHGVAFDGTDHKSYYGDNLVIFHEIQAPEFHSQVLYILFYIILQVLLFFCIMHLQQEYFITFHIFRTINTYLYVIIRFIILNCAKYIHIEILSDQSIPVVSVIYNVSPLAIRFIILYC